MRKGYPIDILCAPKADPTKEDPTRRNFVCGSDVCQQLKEFSIKPAPESSKIVGMFASQLTDYGKIKDAMMDGDDSWKPTLKIAWKPASIDLTADIDAMKKSHGSDPKWTQVLASLETLSFLPINAASLKTLSFLPLKSACDQCRRCALQGGLPDVFHLAVHKLGKELECSKTSRYVTRRAALATSGVAKMTRADLIGRIPIFTRSCMPKATGRPASGRWRSSLPRGRAQTKLMVAMNDFMQPVNEGTSAPDPTISCWSKSTSTQTSNWRQCSSLTRITSTSTSRRWAGQRASSSASISMGLAVGRTRFTAPSKNTWAN